MGTSRRVVLVLVVGAEAAPDPPVHALNPTASPMTMPSAPERRAGHDTPAEASCHPRRDHRAGSFAGMPVNTANTDNTARTRELRFDGRVAVVTGAGSGLGREHALL